MQQQEELKQCKINLHYLISKEQDLQEMLLHKVILVHSDKELRNNNYKQKLTLQELQHMNHNKDFNNLEVVLDS